MKRILTFLALLPILTSYAHALELKDCELQREIKKDVVLDHLYGGRPEKNSRLLVRRAYVVVFDSIHGVPKWAAWRAIDNYLDTPPRESRWKKLRQDYEVSSVHPSDYSSQFAKSENIVRARLVPYYIAGGDRNHNNSKAAHPKDLQINDIYDACTVYEVNSMINIAPQYGAKFNGPSGLWGQLENQIRTLIKNDRTYQVYAGTVYNKSSLQLLGGNSKPNISIPHGFFKIIIDPKQQEAVAFLFDHQADIKNGCSIDSKSLSDCIRPIEQVENATGLSFFSSMQNEERKKLLSTSTGDVWRNWTNLSLDRSQSTPCNPTLASDTKHD
ncbi:DNA/RNA non-specific endonuclease [Teredinibacter turnerae]|uniref:DNA/RNA non-specific endonuclease n=1 Tax=Teredinibacter turnerae TaxID=2426 RepID=UPI0004180265|nr:DNA/RNA non-specific endonuclease [Teredinibacter turnerae]